MCENDRTFLSINVIAQPAVILSRAKNLITISETLRFAQGDNMAESLMEPFWVERCIYRESQLTGESFER